MRRVPNRAARCAHGLVAAFAAAIGISGCRSIDSGLFVDYRTATDQVTEATTEVFQLDDAWTREGYLQRFIEDEHPIRELRLDIALAPLDDPHCPEAEDQAASHAGGPGPGGSASEAPPFTARYRAAPVFASIQASSAAMAALNQTLSQYATLLVKLSGGEIVEQRRLDELARDLNARANGLVTRFAEIGVEAPPEVAQAPGLISVTAVEGFRLYVGHQRKQALEEALEGNQEWIQGGSCMARQALGMVADDVSFEYTERFRPIAAKFDAGGARASRRKQVEMALELNGAVARTLDAVRSLWLAYGKLPGAHRELAISLRARKPSFDDLRAFAAHASHLNALHRELARENAG